MPTLFPPNSCLFFHCLGCSGWSKKISCCSRRDNNFIFCRPKFLWFLWNQKISCTNPNWKWIFNKQVGQLLGFLFHKFFKRFYTLFNPTYQLHHWRTFANWTITLFIFRVAKSSQGREVGDHHSIGGLWSTRPSSPFFSSCRTFSIWQHDSCSSPT